jgi:hypothetical protein
MGLEIQPSCSYDCNYYLCNTFATGILIFFPLTCGLLLEERHMMLELKIDLGKGGQIECLRTSSLFIEYYVVH